MSQFRRAAAAVVLMSLPALAVAQTGLEMVGLRDVHVNAGGTMLTFTAGQQKGDIPLMEHFVPQ